MKKIKIQENIDRLVRQFLKKYQCPYGTSFYLEAPRLREFGDLTSNICFKISKSFKKSPLEIAKIIVAFLKEHMAKTGLSHNIDEITVGGNGFINFYFSKNYFYEVLRQIIKEKEAFGRTNIGKARRVLIEFVSANPTGSLSIAHARQAAVGDSLARILSSLGYKVKKEYFLNDEGHQIDVLGNSVYLRLKQLQGEQIDFPEDGYQGDYIYDIARKIIAEKKDTRQDLTFFSEYAVKEILSVIKKELDSFGVHFDYWTSQKELRKSGKIKKALLLLKKRGFLYEKEGAVWFKSSAFGDDKDRVVIKSDGSYTYLAPDIAYHRQKYKRGFQWLIDIWGPDHHGYINRLKASVAALGYDAKTLDIIIIQLATIYRDGRPVIMSTRKAQYITLSEVLNEIGSDAARFFFLMRRTSAHLDFDLELAKKQTPQNPVFYIQYAYARINSIIEKAKEKGLAQDIYRIINKINFHLLESVEEMNLMRTLAQFPYAIELCAQHIDPYNLSVYLQDLATDFHKFYDCCRVLNEDKDISLARLALCYCAKIVLDNGLKMAGVSAPEKM